ncbi:helix-turn-helix transcriptional regulator [Actinomadura keratinilytica]|jgi:tetratricopeptide (TPR) repeat protein
MTFAEKLRELMAERGLSLRELSRTVPYDKGNLSRVINGHKRPSEKLAARLDDILNANGELVALRSSSLSLDRRALNGDLTPDDEERLIQAARRPGRTDLAVVESLSTILAAQRRLEDVIGSEPLLKTVGAQLTTVERLVIEARGRVRPRVLDIAAQWAQFDAWLHASVRRLAKADQLYDRAIVWATEAGNADMVATAFNMKGHTAWLRRDVAPMVGLSEAAQRDRHTSPGVRALAVQQEARGLAILGDAASTDRKFDEARELTTQAAEHPEDEPPWIYFFSPDMLTMQHGRAYRYLGRHAKAIELLTAGLDDLSAEVRHSEWVAYYRLDQVRSLRALHEEAEAERILGEVAGLAERLGSARLARHVAMLR